MFTAEAQRAKAARLAATSGPINGFAGLAVEDLSEFVHRGGVFQFAQEVGGEGDGFAVLVVVALFAAGLVLGLGFGGGDQLGDDIRRGRDEGEAFQVRASDLEGVENGVGVAAAEPFGEERIDDVHEGDLDGVLIVEGGDGDFFSVEALAEALVVVAEVSVVLGGAATADAIDLGIGALSGIGMDGHGEPRFTFRVSRFTKLQNLDQGG
jgi:hypothetical protein